MLRTLHPIAAAAALGVTGCGDIHPPSHLRVPGGNPEIGRQLVQKLGCGACHTIPRVAGAHGMVGPPLESFAHRAIVAGHLPNVPRTLVPFLIDPPALRPATAMPNLGLQPAAARDIAAFLYTLGAHDAAVAIDAAPAPAPGSEEAATPVPLALGAARP